MMFGRFRARAVKRGGSLQSMRSRKAPIFLPMAARIAYSTTRARPQRRIRGERGGRGSAAPYLGADRQRGRGLDPGWQGCSLHLGARQLLGLSPAVSHPCRWHRIAHCSPPAQRDYGHLLGGRKYAGLRARGAMAKRLETLPRRPDHTGVAGEHEDPRPGEDSARELERFEPGVGGQHGLLPLRPQWPCLALQL